MVSKIARLRSKDLVEQYYQLVVHLAAQYGFSISLYTLVGRLA
jgi:hypothetical protein